MNAGKLLNLYILELIVNYMTILTASMGTSAEQCQSRKRRMPYHMFNGMHFYLVLAKRVFLDNIETYLTCKEMMGFISSTSHSL